MRKQFISLSILLSILLACFAGIASADPDDLVPFSFDGCSSIAPEGYPWGGNPYEWCDCCLAHDKAYWKGGTYQERLDADNQLRTCVEQHSNWTIGTLFYLGVRAGGSPYYFTDYRWGYGWPYGRFYQSLTAAEEDRAQMLLDEYESDMAGVSCADQIE